MSFRTDAIRALVKEWKDHPSGRPELYWSELVPQDPNYDGDWCGALALRSLKKAGMAKGVLWQVGLGFISPLRLPRVAFPQPGDILVVPQPFQHQAMVVEADPATGMITSIDGNQPGIEPRVRFVKNGNIEFYSIQPLVDEAERNASSWGYVAAGALLMGAAAYIWLNGVPRPIERGLQRLGV